MAGLIGDIAILNLNSSDFNNKKRFDHNNFGDNSSSGSWNRSRGHKSHGKSRRHGKGRSKDC